MSKVGVKQDSGPFSQVQAILEGAAVLSIVAVCGWVARGAGCGSARGVTGKNRAFIRLTVILLLHPRDDRICDRLRQGEQDNNGITNFISLVVTFGVAISPFRSSTTDVAEARRERTLDKSGFVVVAGMKTAVWSVSVL